MHFVYILKLTDETYYVGQTKDIDARTEKHVKGKVKSTSRYESKDLVWYGAFNDKITAIKFEKYLKTSSGKSFRNRHLI
jgi:predicted GIY-YIG superfamily endonuclease